MGMHHEGQRHKHTLSKSFFVKKSKKEEPTSAVSFQSHLPVAAAVFATLK